MRTRTFIEARCPKCSKTHKVMAEDNEPIQTAYCPPSTKHRKWTAMKPGQAQVEAKKALFG